MTNQLSAAQKWMSRAAKTASLTVLPLAVAAIANAGVILDPSSSYSGGCRNSGFGASQPTCTLSQLATDGSGSQGIGWVLNSPYSLGTNTDFEGYAGGSNPVSGSLPGGVVPFAWTVSTSSGFGRLYVSAYNYTSGQYASSGQIDLAGSGTHSGSGTLTFTQGIADGQYVSFNFNAYADPFNYADQDSLGDVPPTSFDVFSLQFFPVSATPEPGTVVLLGGAIGVLGLVLRRKHRA